MKRERETGLDIVLDPSRAEASLWRRARFEDDGRSRETLFNRYVVLARSIAARQFRWRRQPADRADAEHFAYEGLLQALDRFDPLQGVPFGAYARPRITGSVADGLSQMSDVEAQIGQRRRLRQERLRSLSPTERQPADPLAALADLAVDLALGLMLEGTGMLVESEEGSDTRPSAYEGLAWHQTQVALADAIERLPDAENAVIRQHYHTGLSFAHVAELLRLSRGRVSQLHKSAVDRLRRRLRHH
ncbi:sigma-70 family RNA polymerase sigma factor [Sphingomonas sp.]|jgi:RNA polymerase sigma factor for flagellar operon FliA|uniref:sigma-70 family RNA polymerase sigma factor n=1 Tax=Sphingomonas sp. TaxID=28214 RepID=UPI002E347572|nr:sigma-70 family RNA polymerase sigma factor [Sphingomonas sp.]HEX4695787.1 sigma-70 family RNA polymerase sigma factor [Sphingomonas sp.]